MANMIHPTLDDFRGRYAMGWTPDDIEIGLRDLSAILGVELVCVWQGDNEGLFAGESDIYVVNDGMVEALEDGGALFGFIVDSEGRPEDVVKAVGSRLANVGRECRFIDLRSDLMFQRNFAWGKQ